MKYTAINIGPILQTFSMARKPRELWAASYMFSYLMKCIIDKFSSERIVSPAKLSKNADNTVGLYPDRLFVEGEVKTGILEDSFNEFAARIGLDIQKTRNYFNLMSVTVVANNDEEINSVLTRLNHLLDRMELCNLTVDENARIAVRNYLAKGSYQLENVTGKKFRNFSIETIASINIFKGENEIVAGDKSDKYICIVQADGDNMGKVVSNMPLKVVSSLSGKLLTFGQKSCQTIRNYGGLPIYAGGDDLLFFAPVLTSKGSIFNLIEELDKHYKDIQAFVDDYQIKDKEGIPIRTSMSYGVSMTYQKFPLYEALGIAQRTLFEVAKGVKGKNAVAWLLQKHSGSSFEAALSKNMIYLYRAFEDVICATENEQLVSAVAHKIFHNEVLLSLWLDEPDLKIVEQRINNFFDEIIDIESKSESALAYIKSVKKLLLEIYKVADYLLEQNNEKIKQNDRLKKMKQSATIVYGMLRTAKFVKGKEEEK